MSDYTFKRVLARAFRETREAVRLDSPIRIAVALAVPAIVGFGTWLATGQPAMTGLFAVAALVTVGFLVFVGKMISVPLAIASTASADRARVEGELSQRIAALEAKQAEQRNPDGVYQHGILVGQVVNGHIDMGCSSAIFQHVMSEGNFDPRAEFEYREWRMIVTEMGPHGSMIGIGCTSIRFNHVIARLIARRA